MITKQQYQESLLHEIKVIKHLATKALPETYDYKPTEGQRTTLELMQYLSHIGGTLLEAVIKEVRPDFAGVGAKAQEVTPENFASHMDAQAEKIKTLLAEMPDADVNKEYDMWGNGHPQTKGVLLIDSILKNMVAYRMQLFLYIKASGRHDIGTAEAWRGEDSKATQTMGAL